MTSATELVNATDNGNVRVGVAWDVASKEDKALLYSVKEDVQMRSSKKILALVVVLVMASTTMPTAALAMPNGSTHSLTTTFTGDNSQRGIMFDISVTGPTSVVVDGFDAAFLPGTHTASVYMRTGSYMGAELSPVGWTLVGTQTLTSTARDTPSSLDIGGIVLKAGQTYGFLFHSNSTGVGYTTGSHTYNDSNLTIAPGKGVGGLFTDDLYDDRTWNGTIYYHTAHAVTASTGSGGVISPSGTTYAASGSSLTYTITPDSGYRIASVLVDSVDQGEISNYTFDNVQASHTIAANFIADTPTPPTDSDPIYVDRNLKNNSGITVSGTDIHRSAGLSVRNLDESVLPTALREAAAGGRLILGYDVSLSRGFRGSIDLSFPVGSAYEGQFVTILHYVNGSVETYTAVVTNGMATITVDSLSPFLVLTTGVTTPESVVLDPPKTGGAGSVQGLVMVLVALTGVTMPKRRKG